VNEVFQKNQVSRSRDREHSARPLVRLLCLILLGLYAGQEYYFSGLVRRTMVFYSIIEGTPSVEERLLKRSGSRELDVQSYVEEVCLGPVSPDSAPLFPRETRLRSLLLREGVVYADLTESAAMPPPEGGDVYRSFRTLGEGIRRNFSWVEDIRFFINGRAVFRTRTEEF